MKEIGEKLQEARVSMGISIEEAAEDLKLKPSQLENIEAGNREAFKDIFYLKYFIRDYAKYLGLDYEEMVEDFNEFVFDYTSKISLEDIKKANKKHEKKQAKKIASPYTLEEKKKNPIAFFLIVSFLILLVCVVIFLIITFAKKGDKDDEVNGINSKTDVSYVLVG